ncbi:MAG TPA: ornithine carbamoyltransferase [Anaerolineae bacterium]|nr:ornithine carbamoyltransferase [Anaerolineae bacterium]
MQHLVTVADLSTSEIWRLLELAADLKDEWRGGGNKPLLAGKTLGMVFQKPSLRTRVSFEMGMAHLGGRAMYLSPQEIQLGLRESVADIARVLSRYVHGIMARVFAHADVEELAAHASVPVINGLSDFVHPCQALSDLFTIYERRGAVEGVTLAYLGDGNNVANSLLLAGSRVGMEIRVATPSGHEPNAQVVSKARKWAQEAGGEVVLDANPRSAVRGADVIYTDVWTSMGQEAEREARLPLFRPYQINQELLALAKPDAVVMHCLPAHRGEEITDEVIDGPQSIVLDQAENRMHLQKAILVSLMAG